jgi:UDP-N-acetylglucosamine 1-carboxyvinyltransferase
MAKNLTVRGGNPVHGEVRAGGNKNAVLPMIAASLLTSEPIVLRNVPNILDVQAMLAIAAELGADVVRNGDSATITASSLKSSEIPRHLCSRIRTSILFAAPLLARCGKATIFPPGGDVIGRRRLDGHFYGLTTLGATIESESFPYRFSRPSRFRGRELFLDEASVTATEQILMAAVLAEGRTTIYNAASEPHVNDLAQLLNKMGAQISGLHTNTMTIDGVDELHGAEHDIGGDYIEAGSFLALAAATGGEITVRNTVPRHFWMIRRVFQRLGITFEIGPDFVRIGSNQSREVSPDFGNAVPIIDDGPWPQFPSDMMSCSIVAATQMRGTVLFFEKMFESRIYFVDRLISMGANAIVCDPHRVVISGPAHMHGVDMTSPDIRAGMAMLIAALCAKGESTIRNADVIERGYENLVEKIREIGGDIEFLS